MDWSFQPVKDEELVKGLKVHVRGWNAKCVFRFQEIENGRAVLKTTRNKTYKVDREKLLHTRFGALNDK